MHLAAFCVVCLGFSTVIGGEAAAPQGEVKQSSPGERSFRRGCCSMAFLVAYYFWTAWDPGQ